MSCHISGYFNVQGGLNLFHGCAVNSDADDFTTASFIPIQVNNDVVIRLWGFPNPQHGRLQLILLYPLLRTADRLTGPGCWVTASSLDGLQILWRLCCFEFVTCCWRVTAGSINWIWLHQSQCRDSCHIVSLADGLALPLTFTLAWEVVWQPSEVCSVPNVWWSSGLETDAGRWLPHSFPGSASFPSFYGPLSRELLIWSGVVN